MARRAHADNDRYGSDHGASREHTRHSGSAYGSAEHVSGAGYGTRHTGSVRLAQTSGRHGSGTHADSPATHAGSERRTRRDASSERRARRDASSERAGRHAGSERRHRASSEGSRSNSHTRDARQAATRGASRPRRGRGTGAPARGYGLPQAPGRLAGVLDRRFSRGMSSRSRRMAAGKLAPVACGFIAVTLGVFLIKGALTPAAPKLVAGTGGMERTHLFGSSGSSFAASLILPEELAPTNPSWPEISGTTKRAGKVMRELVEAIDAVEDSGYEVGFALYDVSTGITVTYNGDESYYSASSIKGPYVAGLARYDLGDSITSVSNSVSNILVYSDNASYSNLRDTYGNASFQQLVDASGAVSMPSRGATEAIRTAAASQSDASIADNKYEFFTPNHLLALWKVCYQYLSSTEPGASWLSAQFEHPETSAIHVAASSLGTTWSKAGWYPADTSGYSTTVDAGVVRAQDGDFILAVMTNKPEDFTTMETIVSPLITLRAALVSA